MTRKRVEKILRYNAVFESCKEGGFTVTVPKLPGVITEGDTFEDALKNAKDAIKGYLKVVAGAGEKIPSPDDERSFVTPVDVSFGIHDFA